MTAEIREFTDYLRDIKKKSKNTEISYQRDLMQLAAFLQTLEIYQVEKVTETSLNSYILYLEKEGKAAATISRELAISPAGMAAGSVWCHLGNGRERRWDAIWNMPGPSF